jgi:diadenosine tetraphosphate (Ap4A) HIT family hydrolase
VIDCPLCPPRPASNLHAIEIAPLSISTLYLRRDQRFRGYSLLAFEARHATGLEELSAGEYNAFMADLRHAVRAVHAAVQPDHMNYECLGNRSPHLHWHVIPRYRDDPRWGYPIWDGEPFEPRQITLPESELEALRDQIKRHLGVPPQP